MSGSRRPCQAGNGSILGESHILEVLSHRLCIAQVMMLGNEAIEEFFTRGSSDLQQCDWGEVL